AGNRSAPGFGIQQTPFRLYLSPSQPNDVILQYRCQNCGASEQTSASSTCGINKVRHGLKWYGPCFIEGRLGWRCWEQDAPKNLHSMENQYETDFEEVRRRMRQIVQWAELEEARRQIVGDRPTRHS